MYTLMRLYNTSLGQFLTFHNPVTCIVRIFLKLRATVLSPFHSKCVTI